MTTTTELTLRRLDLAVAGEPERDRLFRRSAVPDAAVRATVRDLLAEVRQGGGDAVRTINARVGGGLSDGRLLVGAGDAAKALAGLDPELRAALEQAIANVRRFAETQRPATTTTVVEPGVEIERRWSPIGTVGCYVPGGTAPLPSSLVMTAVPAQVAGVERIVVATPAARDGRVDPVVLATAALLSIERIVIAGGAQAIAALAFGLPAEGVPPADLIVGPGSTWVTAAKLELAGEVGIDLPAGPSEGLVLADGSADPEIVAADLLTQAEHGLDSPAILVTTNRTTADNVERALQRRLATEPRAAILERSLAEHGRIVLAPDLDAAIAFVNGYGPEHLSVELREEDLEPAVGRIRNAGSIFVGRWAPESAGDYATGANHVLPTGGLARSSGALSVELFGKFNQVQRLTRDGLARLAPAIRAIADAEGLHAHRAAVDVRFERPEPESTR
jgi:histidinol dehydrogenase